MRMLLAMLLLIATAAVGWTAWWFVVATAKDRALEAWLAERRAAGWVAEAEAIDVGGFPYRVDTTVRGLELANPEGGWAWSAPAFQFTALAYQPNQLIAIWPPEQTFSTPLGVTRVTSETMRASLVVEPNARLGLRRATVELADLGLEASPDWRVGVGKAIVALRQARAGGADGAVIPDVYDLAFTAEGVAPPETLAGGLGSGVLPPVIDTMRFEATASFDRPLDRLAIEGERPSIERLSITNATFAWGRLDLRARGTVVADARGFAEGRIDLHARDWRQMLDLAEQSGALAPAVAGAVRSGLGLIARLGGDRDSIDVPLDFSGGVARLGPIPLGPAPRLAAP